MVKQLILYKNKEVEDGNFFIFQIRFRVFPALIKNLVSFIKLIIFDRLILRSKTSSA
jgi:hypothetical protein